jgi:tetraprenyl-beta-curcumene synthase
MPDPASLTRTQLKALMVSATRELLWGLRAVRREHHVWLARAATIPDRDLRRHALAALRDKRPLLDGAALFWTIPDRRHPELLRLLVAFQVLANYHDHASERWGAGDPRPDPGRSMDGFAEVVDLRLSLRHHRPSSAHPDGGYLAALAATCRDGCRRLVAYEAAREHLVLAAWRAKSLDLEHLPDEGLRRGALERFTEQAFGARADLTWFELAAGGSSLLTAIVVLAVAVDDASTPADLAAAVEVYTLVATVSALLDNYVDYDDDLAAGRHNYLNYYASFARAVERLAELVADTLREAGRLRHGMRHRVIVASMVAMYLTSEGARKRDAQTTTSLVASGGHLTAVLVPVLSLWRSARRETGA